MIGIIPIKDCQKKNDRRAIQACSTTKTIFVKFGVRTPLLCCFCTKKENYQLFQQMEKKIYKRQLQQNILYIYYLVNTVDLNVV